MLRSLMLFLAGSLLIAAEVPPGLMPVPAKLTAGTGRLRLSPEFAIGVSGHNGAQLQAAVTRLRERLVRQTGLRLIPDSAEKRSLVVECAAAAPSVPKLGEDESYTLDVAITGAKLTAPTVTGALRGLATFAQLVAADAESFYVPALHIEDRPRFPYRGLMLDSGRHWIPVAVMEHHLDAMEEVKLNVLHWHLSEDQGFRVESKKFPLLHQKGSDGLYYTQDEIRHIVEYARLRGIRVIPEFDIPGHSTAWLVGYPELASAPGPYSIEREWGICKPVLNPANEKVYEFLDGFFGEMAALFPDEFFHIGGDEVLDNHWKANPEIQKFMAAHQFATAHDLQAYFNRRIQAILQKHGKVMVGWDEILRPDLPKTIVIQSWRGQASLAEAAVQGYRGILSFGYYLDHLRPAAYHYGVDPTSGKAASLTPEQAARILGGEACMWTEYTSQEDLDSHVWPRTAAIAERLWSSAGVKDVDSMYARMAQVSRNLEFLGLQHRAYTRPALERLAGAAHLAAMETLAAAVETNRLDLIRKLKYTSRTPLIRLMDAVPPESESIRALEKSVSAGEYGGLRETLTAWRGNYSQLKTALAANFIAKECLPLSENLSKAGAIGLEALGYLEAKKSAPAGWAATQAQALKAIDKPVADVTLSAVRVVKALVAAASK